MTPRERARLTLAYAELRAPLPGSLGEAAALFRYHASGSGLERDLSRALWPAPLNRAIADLDKYDQSDEANTKRRWVERVVRVRLALLLRALLRSAA